MIETILLDIDGVCNTFQHHVFNSFELHYPDDSCYPVGCGWDIVAAANKLAGCERFTPASFWNAISRETWASVPTSPEFGFILGWAEARVGRKHVHFLTSPTLSADCLAGKLEWIHRHAPKWMQRQFLIGPSKHLCAKPSVLLIDDGDKNVAAFKEEGGNAILLPRPWNSLHNRDPVNYLSEQFKSL